MPTTLLSQRVSAQVPHGVDTSLFYPPTSKERKAAARAAQFGWGLTDIVVLFVGAITRQKGVPELVRAFARLVDAPSLAQLEDRGQVPVVRLVLKGNEALYKGSRLLQELLAQLPPHVSAVVEVRAGRGRVQAPGRHDSRVRGLILPMLCAASRRATVVQGNGRSLPRGRCTGVALQDGGECFR